MNVRVDVLTCRAVGQPLDLAAHQLGWKTWQGALGRQLEQMGTVGD